MVASPLLILFLANPFIKLLKRKGWGTGAALGGGLVAGLLTFTLLIAALLLLGHLIDWIRRQRCRKRGGSPTDLPASDTGMGLVLLAFLVFLVGFALSGVFLFIRDHPRVALPFGIFFLALLWLGWLHATRPRRQLAALLAQSQCPECGAVYGAKAARAARCGKRPISDCRSPVFGCWAVHCPACGIRCLFHPITHELLVAPQSEVA